MNGWVKNSEGLKSQSWREDTEHLTVNVALESPYQNATHGIYINSQCIGVNRINYVHRLPKREF
jgi:hypothetical protein